MKRIFVILMACMFLLTGIVPLACGGQNTVTFEWEQPGDITDLHSWRLYVSETPGGPYDAGMTYFQDLDGNAIPWVVFPYLGVPSTVYEAAGTIVVPDQAATNLCFVINAWDTDGNFSGNSNEVCDTFDFLGPGVPYNFKIKVKTRP